MHWCRNAFTQVLQIPNLHLVHLSLDVTHVKKSFFFFFFCWSNNHVKIVPGHAWAIPAGPIVCRNILDFVVFPQDGAQVHFVHIVCKYLNETFPGRWIERVSQRFWIACSRDLTPLDFFAWGHIKTQVNKVKIRDLQHLHKRISATVNTITPAMLQRVFRCTEKRWYLCLDMEGNRV